MQKLILDNLFNLCFWADSLYADFIVGIGTNVFKVAESGHVDESQFVRAARIVTLFVGVLVFLDNNVVAQ